MISSHFLSHGFPGARAPFARQLFALTLAAACAQAYSQTAEPRALKEVVVSGARSERALEDVPAAVDVLDGDDLDPASVQDIRDLVRELPNVEVKRASVRFGVATPGGSGRDGNAGFNIRGLEGNRVLLTVDGIRVPRALSSDVLGSASFGRDYYDLGLVSRVEILRGPNSALYGSDGLAGLVAMFTTQPQDLLKEGKTFGGRLGASLSTDDGGRRIGATLAGKASDEWQWLVSAQAGKSRELDNQGTNNAMGSARTTPNPQDDEQYALLGKLVWTPGGGQRHTFAVEHVNRSGDVEVYSGRVPPAPPFSPYGVSDLDGQHSMERTRLSWDGRWRLGSAWADELRATLGWQTAKSREVATSAEYHPVNPPRSRVRDVTYTEDVLQAVLQAEKVIPLGKDWSSKLVYGVDLSRADIDNLVTGLVPPTGETYPLRRFPQTIETVGAVFVQSEFASENWSLIPALRYDHVSLDAKSSPLYALNPVSLSTSALTPKIGAIWRPGGGWNVFANLAAGFRSPDPLQLNNYYQNIGQGYQSIPNPNLKPEKSTTLDLGVRGKGGAFEWEAVAFTGRYRDFIEDLVTVQTVPILQYQSVNRDRVTLSGFELKGSWRVTPATTLRAAYGQTRGTVTSTNLPLNSVNPAQLMLGAEHRVGDWTLGATLIHVAAKPRSDVDFSDVAGQFVTPSHTTLDLKASWAVSPGWKLSAAIHNVTDRKYWEWTNVRGIAANAVALDAYTAPGRSFSVALSHQF